MADLFDTLPQVGSLQARADGAAPRRGRPKGSTNKRGGDLKAILVTTYGGRTPGQQLATVCMVTPKEVRQAKARAKGLGIDAELMAMIEKAERLAVAMGWPGQGGVRDAWAMMFKAYGELLPYIHQRLPQAEAPKEGAPLPLIMLPDGPDVQATLPTMALGEDEEFQGLSDMRQAQLSQPNSHD